MQLPATKVSDHLRQLFKKGFSDSEVSFAKAAFSNLVGGISYFYGKSKWVGDDFESCVMVANLVLFHLLQSDLWDLGDPVLSDTSYAIRVFWLKVF